MRLQPLTESVIDLNFMPLEDINNLPCLVAENCRFAGFEQMDKALYLDEPLETALLQYKKLTLPELSRLYMLITKNSVPFNWEKFLKNYQFKWTSDLENLFKNLSQTKLSFQNWVSQKDCGLSELQILNWGMTQYPFEKIDKLLNFIARVNPSRHTGTKILEYALEKLEDFDLNELLNLNSADEAYNFTYKLRFPETSKKDLDFKKEVLTLPWPAHIKVTPARQADRSGLEIRFFVGSYEEFEKRVDGLSQIKEKLEKDLWNKN